MFHCISLLRLCYGTTNSCSSRQMWCDTQFVLLDMAPKSPLPPITQRWTGIRPRLGVRSTWFDTRSRRMLYWWWKRDSYWCYGCSGCRWDYCYYKGNYSSKCKISPNHLFACILLDPGQVVVVYWQKVPPKFPALLTFLWWYNPSWCSFQMMINGVSSL